VLGKIRRNEAAFRTRWITLITLGFFVVWIGPALAATIVLLYQVRHLPDPQPWGQLFVWCSVIGLPILFALEWATRGSFMESAMDGLGDPDTIAGRYAHTRGGVAVLLTEISLWGPRMVIAGARRLAAAARLGKAPQAPAAALLAVMLRQEDGMSSGQALTQSGLDADSFGDALGYLTFHEIVGISKDGTRLWVATEARKRLTA
jgi:hypothetical protein